MPEIGKLKRSWLLLTTSLTVLSRHRKLLVFPLVTLAFAVVTVLFFTAPVILIPTGHAVFSGEHWIAVGQRVFENPPIADSHGRLPARVGPKPWLVGYLAVAYLVLMFLSTFSNVAFANEIFNALNGRTVSIRSGLLFAWNRIGSILVWSLFAGLIGILIRSLERRFGWIGRIILRTVGVVWSVASVFVIPVIVREPDLNPIALLRKSAGTLRKTWGESLAGYLGINMVVTLFVLGSMAAAFMTAIPSLALGQWQIAAAVVAVWLLAAIAFGYVSGVADQIYRCALYVYASEGVTPEPYSGEMMDMAWKIQRRPNRQDS